MKNKKLLWQLYPSYLLIALASLLVVSWYIAYSLHNFYLEKKSQDLESYARLLEEQVLEHIQDGDLVSVDNLCKKIKISARITVVKPDGIVIGDSEKQPALMDSHIDREEIILALLGKVGNSIRYSQTLQKNMMYVAVPITTSGNVVAVVRTSISISDIYKTLRQIFLEMSAVVILVAFCAAIVSYLVSLRITRPLQACIRGVERFAQGDLSFRLEEPKSEEMAALAKAMNQMALQVKNRMESILRQRNEYEAVLSSMIESVLAVNNENIVINMNQAAKDLFQLPQQDIEGSHFQQILPNEDLQKLMRKVLDKRGTIEEDILLKQGNRHKILQAKGIVLQDGVGNNIGGLLVINDVTRLRKLEKLRKDFVANVSHELKTPITSIKGFVETLLDGAMHSPDELEHFLKIVARQADRLHLIIEDILMLSRIEQGAEQEEIALAPHSIKEVIENAIETCEPQTIAKNVSLEYNCEDNLEAKINSTLLEQGIVNLIDNAAKYSDPGDTIEISACKKGNWIEISVKDEGCGIPEDHLARLFERFYRVDKARSRDLGGTGLGLAIVKHIALAHHGDVRVESKVGEGSCFSIILKG